MIRQLLFSLFIFAQFSFAQNYGTISFTNYADDKQSAFSLTFDDGLKTHYDYVKPILDAKNFKGTFYVLPPYLTEAGQPTIWRYGTWSEFQLLAAEGHEIGSHTMNHYDLTSLQWGDVNDDSTLLYELYQSKIFIEQKIPEQKCISLNYPYTLHNSIVDSAASLFYENGRTLGQTGNDSSLTSSEWFGLKAKVVEFSLPRNSVDDDLDELYSFIDWTQDVINHHQWGMIIIHDVVPFTSLDSLIGLIYQPITNEWLDWLCNWLELKSLYNDLWVETVGNITRYIKERDAAEYQIISLSNQLIEIIVSDNLDDTIYNYPLSAYVKIPDEWNYVRAQQNDLIDTLTTIATDTGRVVLTKVTPDNGILKLTPVTPIAVEDEFQFVDGFELFQNYPNPFNPSTIISWQSPVSGWQTLKVYDVLGHEVETLVDEYKPAGIYNVQFTMNNLSSGVYFYQLRAKNFIHTKRMILMK